MAASLRMRNALTLFSSNDCVLCHRVRLVLAAKGVSYDLAPVDPQVRSLRGETGVDPPEERTHLHHFVST